MATRETSIHTHHAHVDTQTYLHPNHAHKNSYTHQVAAALHTRDADSDLVSYLSNSDKRLQEERVQQSLRRQAQDVLLLRHNHHAAPHHTGVAGHLSTSDQPLHTARQPHDSARLYV